LSDEERKQERGAFLGSIHQVHHRAQATTLLMQAGRDIGVSDLIALVLCSLIDSG
jgi:uncharacterized damage-inducible protein DinB